MFFVEECYAVANFLEDIQYSYMSEQFGSERKGVQWIKIANNESCGCNFSFANNLYTINSVTVVAPAA